jgi:hypothetical protein
MIVHGRNKCSGEKSFTPIRTSSRNHQSQLGIGTTEASMVDKSNEIVKP